MKSDTINMIIREVMKETGTTQSTMAAAIGLGKATDVSARLNSKNMTFDRVIEMLTVMGYEVTVQKKPKGRRPEGQYLVERSDSKKGGDEA